MEISRLLEQYPFISDHKIILSDFWDDGFYFKIEFDFKDGSRLFARHYFDSITGKIDYSFHWQNSKDKLLKRWDNTKHHKHIKTFPFHLHLPGKIEESKMMSLEDVLSVISKSFSGKKKK